MADLSNFPRMTLGINCVGDNYFDELTFYTNRAMASGWSRNSGDYSVIPPANLDANGEIVSLPAGVTSVFRNAGRLSTSGAAGRITWANGGTSSFSYYGTGVTAGASSTNQRDFTQTLDQQPVDTDSARHRVVLQFGAVDLVNPPRAMKVVQQGDPDQLIHPDWLALHKPFRILRVLDWVKANSNNVDGLTWAARTPPTHISPASTPGGTPYEHLIEAANAIGADLWLPAPMGADDDYYTRMCMLLRDGPAGGEGLKGRLYLEWANEPWNPGLGTYTYALGKANAAGLSGANSYGVGADLAKALRFQAQRSGQLMDIAASIFAPGRLVRVIGAQQTYAQVADVLIEYGAAARHDMLVCGGYYGNNAGTVPTTSNDPAVILPRIAADVDAMEAVLIAHKAKARAAGMRFGVYEWGQHFAKPGAMPLADFKAIQRRATMYDITVDAARRVARHADVGLYYSDVGPIVGQFAYGAKEYQEQPTASAPKYDALIDVIAAIKVADGRAARRRQLGLGIGLGL